MQPLCVKRQAFEGEVYLAIRNEGADIVRNEGGLIGANTRLYTIKMHAKAIFQA
jgi:hypothetical protein